MKGSKGLDFFFFQRKKWKLMNREDPGKTRMHPMLWVGFWKSFEPSLQFSGGDHNSGNSEAAIREKSWWTLKYKRMKPQNESSAGFGQCFASRWLFVLEICQVWIHDEGASVLNGLQRSLGSHPDGVHAYMVMITIFLPLPSTFPVSVPFENFSRKPLL